jgi:hypothetical protein
LVGKNQGFRLASTANWPAVPFGEQLHIGIHHEADEVGKFGLR